jgi:3-hydroxyacyl-[acyl-carrier-protein] dehydratase
MIKGDLTMTLSNIEIQKILPHRYPFLLVDKITELEEGKRIVGVKNVTANEPQFTGHFPGNPIMPGVLITEALAQVGAVLLLSMPENRGKLGLFTGINNFKFRRQVVPGDTLTLEADLLTYRHGMGKANVKATVEGQVAAMGEISFAVVENAAAE